MRPKRPALTELAGIRIGDAVSLPTIQGVFEVVGIPDESTLVLRAPSGAEVKAGWRAVRRHPRPSR